VEVDVNTNGGKSLVRGRDRARGAALIELLFALMVMVALSFGVAEYGMAFMVKHNLQAAAREGARAAALPGGSNQEVSNDVAVKMTAPKL
jgi:Flp pilus assembly protein TadG